MPASLLMQRLPRANSKSNRNNFPRAPRARDVLLGQRKSAGPRVEPGLDTSGGRRGAALPMEIRIPPNEEVRRRVS